MNEPYIVVLITLAGALAAAGAVVFMLAGGDSRRVGIAWSGFLSCLRDAALADKISALLAPPPPVAATPPKFSGLPVRLFALLQRDGRLIDFLMEDISPARCPDEQLAAAVRTIHHQCQTALKEHVVLEPVLSEGEDKPVEVPAGFDPSAIRLTGQVPEKPPFRGVLRHQGWRVKELKLPTPPEGQDERILCPAEVEIG